MTNPPDTDDAPVKISEVAVAGTNGLAVCLAQFLRGMGIDCRLISHRKDHPLHTAHRIIYVDYVDYVDEIALMCSLAGCQLVISMVQGPHQLVLLNAALQAGAHRFVPATFGGITSSENILPFLDRNQEDLQELLNFCADEGMDYTNISCGLLYERLAPRGLMDYFIGEYLGPNGPADFLINSECNFARLPMDAASNPATICMTSMQDLCKVIVAAIEHIPVDDWPRDVRFWSERMNVLEATMHVERVQGVKFDYLEVSRETAFARAEACNQAEDHVGVEREALLVEIIDGVYDFEIDLPAPLPELPLMPLKEWLRRLWMFDPFINQPNSPEGRHSARAPLT